jgi:isocitrate lyase
MGAFEEDIAEIQEFMDGDRFSAATRVYSARQVAEQRGTVAQDYTVAREAAAAFYDLLR